MGKIQISFSLSMFPYGIPFVQMSQAINSLEGTTHITYVSLNTKNGGVWIVDAENPTFLDGTVIMPKYRSDVQITPLGNLNYTVFDGVTVLDPTPQPTAIPVGSPGATGQSTVTVGNGILTLPTSPTGYWTYEIIGGGSATNTVCVCGADKCGGLHSNWCDKKN